MAFIHSPKIVTDNLVFTLDTANPKSYVSGSSVWNDLSGNNTSGSLTNSPTFNSANGGSIVFDRTNDYISIPYDANIFQFGTGNFTFECWYYQTSTVLYQRLFSNGLYGAAGIFQVETPGVNSIGAVATVVVHINNLYSTYTTTTASNIWRNVVVTRNSGNVTVYIDASSIGTQVQNGIINSTTNPTIGSDSTVGGYFGGRIAKISLYKGKSLSAQEILQNFNATRGRFGV